MQLSRPLALSLALTLSLPLLAVAQDPNRDPNRDEARLQAPVQVEVGPGVSQVRLADLVRAWAGATGRMALVDEPLRELKVRLEPGSQLITRAVLLELLQQQGVSVLEQLDRVRALRTRDLPQTLRFAPGQVLEQDAPLPLHNTPVTLTYRVRHVGVSELFGNLRGVLSQDPERTGAIYCLLNSKQLVITDLAPKVARYRRLIRSLDRPAAPALQHLVRVYELRAQVWEPIATLPPTELAQRLRAADDAPELESTRASGVDFELRLQLRNAEGELELRIQRRTVLRHSEGRREELAAPQLEFALSRRAGKDQLERALAVQAPGRGETRVAASTLQHGSAPTYLVVVIETR